MIDKNPESFSDIVDRAAEELRSMPVPPGPPPELLDTLLKAASVSDKQLSVATYNQPLSQLQKIRNIIMKYPFKSLTTFAACCLVLIAAYLAIGPMMHGSVAFAEVSAIIQNAKTMVCTGQTDFPMPGTTKNTKIKIMSLENGRMREEIGSQTVMIFDWPTGKTLSLSPDTKLAVLMKVKGQAKQTLQQDFLTDLKNITQNPKAEDLGLKIMDGKEVKGFRVKNENFTITFWVDSKSGEPITVEYLQQKPNFINKELPAFLKKEIPEMLKREGKGNKSDAEVAQKLQELNKELPDLLKKAGIDNEGKGENTMKIVLSNFQFDVPLDESLFSLTPPEGYKLQELNMDWSGGGEKDVIEVLRRSADMDNGVFPDSLTDQTLMIKLTIKSSMKWSFEIGKQAALTAAQAAKDKSEGKEPKKVSPPEIPPEMLKEQSETGNLIGRMTMFLTENNKGWKYTGKGVKLGDAKTPIFWYVPKDSEQVRVIYSDLSVRDVPADKLPPDPDSEKSDTK
jgi:outer membrane lipoprotein-sorting protein